MELDYDFLKKILDTMVQDDNHMMSSVQLAEAVGVDLNDDAQADKFRGHILILGDESHIACDAPDFGFTRFIDNTIGCSSVEYRITSRGYEFLDILNNKTIFNKIKGHSIATAFEIGKSVLADVLVLALRS